MKVAAARSRLELFMQGKPYHEKPPTKDQRLGPAKPDQLR